jgi:hypothetical protein
VPHWLVPICSGDLADDRGAVVVSCSNKTLRWRTSWLEAQVIGGLYVPSTSVGMRFHLGQESKCWRFQRTWYPVSVLPGCSQGISDMQINQVHDMWLEQLLDDLELTSGKSLPCMDSKRFFEDSVKEDASRRRTHACTCR